ncbi:MAG: alginate lyase family protein [Lewinella sp.]|nr:alginate lyase family protein [Lewinella sp.]
MDRFMSLGLRLFHTLRHLRLRQIAYQLFYRLTGRLADNGARAQVQGEVFENLVLPPLSTPLGACAVQLPVRYTKAGFSFLNQSVHFPSFGEIDWNYAANGKLWVYNLNYFEYLRQPDLDYATGEQLINAWVDAEASHLDGWEPYPISLRLVNWLQFYRAANRQVPDKVQASIRRQYAALHRKREFHLGGNHLFENAIALALTARYLNDGPGRKKADKLFLAELSEQYLSDGAHYERSIMYHLILLWRQLDLYSWVGAPAGWDNKGKSSSPSLLFTTLRKSLTAQLSWAAAMITPAGHYPHFNDSTYGIAPDWSVVKDYAAALGLKAELPLEEGEASGYRHWSHNGLDLWIDAGAIGPDYIPGHAHADNLNFVLHLNGEPIIIDPAISTYEKNPRRALERSTAAHNTVTVNNDQNSSDVWGGFRVGKRARTTIKTDDNFRLKASHDGFSGTVHTRHFTLEKTDNRLTISDDLSGSVQSGVVRLHFASGQAPVVKGGVITMKSCEVNIEGATEISSFSYKAAAGWNCLVDAVGVEMKFQTSVKFEVVGRLINRSEHP